MTETLRFLVLLELVGLAALPLAAVVLGRLPGRGIAFARPLGLLVLTWLAWMAASLGAPNRLGTAIAALALLVALGALLWWRGWRPQRADRRLWLATEAVFVVAFAAGTLYMAFSPDVWGTEKPMDMAFLSASLTAESLPPHDPWLAGADLNYYYVGHFAAALLVRLTDVEPTAGYNLAMGALFGLTAAGGFALAATIATAAREAGAPVRRPLVAGLAAVLLLLLMATPRAGWLALRHAGLDRSFDWFGVSRVIPNTINEFPLFSWVVGDLHGHVNALPWTLLAIAFALQVVLAGPLMGGRVRTLAAAAAAALTVGILYTVNSWSWPLGVVLVAFALVAWLRDPRSAGRRLAAVAWGVGVIAFGLVLVAPFLLQFDPPSRGVGVVGEREPFGRFVTHNAVIYGALVWIAAAGYAARLRSVRHPLRLLVWGGAAVVLWLTVLATLDDLAGAGLAALLAAVAVHALLSRRLHAAERFVWLLLALGFGCVLVAEVLYVRDEFDRTSLFRMNTVFKLGYQAWVLLAVAGGCALGLSRAWLAGWWRVGWQVVAIALLVISGGYIVTGSISRKADFSDGPRVDGRRWLQRIAPGDPGAISWLREHAAPDAVVLEAVGDDYSYFGHARISTYSGRATVLGWAGHEIQWGHDPGTRRDDVAALYRAVDPVAATGTIDRYGIDYVVVGPIERTDYGDDGQAKWARLGEKVYERAGTVVYRLR